MADELQKQLEALRAEETRIRAHIRILLWKEVQLSGYGNAEPICSAMKEIVALTYTLQRKIERLEGGLEGIYKAEAIRITEEKMGIRAGMKIRQDIDGVITVIFFEEAFSTEQFEVSTAAISGVRFRKDGSRGRQSGIIRLDRPFEILETK